MMRNSYKRICYLIAAAGIKEDEVFEFVSYLENAGPSRMARDVALARKNILNPLQNDKQDYLFSYEKEESFRSEIEDKLVKLLVIDTGLTKTKAAELLSQKIHEQDPRIVLPKLGKRSINEWLRAVKLQITPSELLHLATIIRNQYVHQSTTDWSLKSTKD